MPTPTALQPPTVFWTGAGAVRRRPAYCRAHRNCTGAPRQRRDPYPACDLMFVRRCTGGRPWANRPSLSRPLPGNREKRIADRKCTSMKCRILCKYGCRSFRKSVAKCPNLRLVTERFSGSTSPRRYGRGRHSTFFGVATPLCASLLAFSGWAVFCIVPASPPLLRALCARCEVFTRGRGSRRGSTSAPAPSC